MNKQFKAALIGAAIYTGLEIYGNVFFAFGKGYTLGLLSGFGKSADDGIKALRDLKNDPHPVYTKLSLGSAKVTELMQEKIKSKGAK